MTIPVTDAEKLSQILKAVVALEKYCLVQEKRYCESREERHIGRHECYKEMAEQFKKHKKYAAEGKM